MVQGWPTHACACAEGVVLRCQRSGVAFGLSWGVWIFWSCDTAYTNPFFRVPISVYHEIPNPKLDFLKKGIGVRGQRGIWDLGPSWGCGECLLRPAAVDVCLS